MGHTWRLPPSGTAGDAVEGLATSVTDQNPGERVYPLLPSRWTVPPWCRLFYPHVLASLPQLFHLSGHMVEAVPDHEKGGESSDLSPTQTLQPPAPGVPEHGHFPL